MNELERMWIATRSGRGFFPFAPRAGDVVLEDIAVGLARKFRFSGQTDLAYTVAQHSVEVSYRVPDCDALWGLLHDAAEAWLPDVARPIKPAFHVLGPSINGSRSVSVEPFEAVERRILHAVADAMGISRHVPLMVFLADERCLATEMRDLFLGDQLSKWPMVLDARPYEQHVVPVPPETAERMFLQRFVELS